MFYCRYLSTVSPNDLIHSLPWQYLRAADSCNFDPSTYQRVDVKYDVATGKPLPLTSRGGSVVSIESVVAQDDEYRVQWSDGRLSNFPLKWLHDQVASFNGTTNNDRVYWNDLTEERVRESSDLSMDFEDVLSDEGMKQALQSIYRYGILLVERTPVSDKSGVAALAGALGGGSVKTNPATSILAKYRDGGSDTILEDGTDGPLRTLYGSVWSTSSTTQMDGTSIADSAYGSEGLPLHTDMTYLRDPPGLQIFTMVNPAVRGGESVFGDGFAVADKLRTTSPAAFAILSRTNRRYRCVDRQTGWNLQASGPVISLRNGKVSSIRHNDLDRLPDLPPAGMTSPEDIDAFYTSLGMAHHEWDKLLLKDEFRLVMRLNTGDTMIVANQVRTHWGVIPK